MIRFDDQAGPTGLHLGIIFSREDLPRMIKQFERSLNTLSPPDQELLKVLSQMKEVK